MFAVCFVIVTLRATALRNEPVLQPVLWELSPHWGQGCSSCSALATTLQDAFFLPPGGRFSDGGQLFKGFAPSFSAVHHHQRVSWEDWDSSVSWLWTHVGTEPRMLT